MDQSVDEFFKEFNTLPNIDQLTRNFNDLKSMKEKVGFWLKNEDFQAHLHRLIEQAKTKKDLEGKNADYAHAFRLQGNVLFKDKRYEEAIELYTKAAIFAPPLSEELGISHANRSACYLYLDCFEQCLMDIEFALQHDYSNPAKLLMRKSRALSSMGNNLEARQILETLLTTNSTLEKKMKDEIKLQLQSVPSNNQEEKMKQHEKNSPMFWELESHSNFLPAATGSVEIQFDEYKGRKLVAKQKILADEVVLIAEPFGSILRSNWRKEKGPPKCEGCYQSLALLVNPLFACRKCTEVVYCSPKCEVKSWEQFHSFECGILRKGMKWCGDDSLAARVVGIADIPNVMSEFKETPNEKIVSNNYKSLLSLMDHFEDFDAETLLLKSLKAAVLTVLMTEENNSATKVNLDEEQILILGEILLKHILQIKINGMFVTADSNKEKKILLALKANSDDIYGELVSDEENVALGLYPELSLLNHSCDPNLYQRNGIKIVTQALRDIDVGEELTITYGPIARAIPKAERHKELQERYFFICRCLACTEGQYENATAFKCPSCQGPVTYNSIDKSNQCLQCNKENPLCLDKTLKLRDFGRQSIIEAIIGANKFTGGTEEEVITKLKKSYEILTHILYKDNRELGIIAAEIAVCCTKFSRFEDAESYAKISGEITKKLYGEYSYQFAVEMMRLTDLQQMRIETEFPIREMNDKYWLEALSVLNDTVLLYQKHVGNEKLNKESYGIRSWQLQNLKNQQTDLSRKYKESNSMQYTVNLMKKLKTLCKT